MFCLLGGEGAAARSHTALWSLLLISLQMRIPLLFFSFGFKLNFQTSLQSVHSSRSGHTAKITRNVQCLCFTADEMLSPKLLVYGKASRPMRQANKNSSKINPVNRNLWEETYGAVSYKTQGGRMVKPQLLLSLQGNTRPARSAQ